MSEVYVLVKQVPGRPNGEVTLHGITDTEEAADVWSAASDEHFSVLHNGNEIYSEPWSVEDDSE